MEEKLSVSKTLTYSGYLKTGPYGENSSALFIGHVCIAKELDDQICDETVSVRYWLSDREKTKSQLVRGHIQTMFGCADTEYTDAYSEYTGYLWTNEKLDIGGHDLLGELLTHENKYILLEIDVH